MLSGLQKISVYDPATGTVVQLNKVAPSASFKLKEPIIINNTSKHLIYDGDDSFLEFAAYDDGSFEQLETWMKAKTAVNIVGAGVEEHFAWYESAPITVKKSYGFGVGNKNTIIISIQKSRGTHNIVNYTNLLRNLGKWEDADLDTMADLLSFTSGNTVWDNVNKRQSIQEASSGITAYGIVIFPISGIRFYGVPNIQSGSAGTTIYLKFLSYSDSVLASYTGLLGASLNAVAPSSTYKIRFEIRNLSATATIFNLPFLGVFLNKGYSNINY